jgi:hypothetical protein
VLPTEKSNSNVDLIKKKLDSLMATFTNNKEDSDEEKLKANENIDEQMSDDYSKQERALLEYLSLTLDDMLELPTIQPIN